MTDHLSAHRTRSNVPSRREVATGATNSPALVPEYPPTPASPTAPRIGEHAFTADGIIRRWTGEGWVKAGTWDTTLDLASVPRPPIVQPPPTIPPPRPATADDWAEFWAEQPEFHPYEDHIERGQE